jgi:hypothetical protein
MVHSLGVVVNQRDRYDWPEALIAALYQNVPVGTPVLFVDGGSPPAVRDVLKRSAEQWGFELLQREAFTSANQARLLALERLSVTYLLCVENDVRLAAGLCGGAGGSRRAAACRCGGAAGAGGERSRASADPSGRWDLPAALGVGWDAAACSPT